MFVSLSSAITKGPSFLKRTAFFHALMFGLCSCVSSQIPSHQLQEPGATRATGETSVRNLSGESLKQYPGLEKRILKFPENATRFVAKHRPQDLADTAYFVDALKHLLDSDLKSDEKAYAFYLMNQAFGWGYNGLSKIPKGSNFVQAFHGETGFHASIQMALERHRYEVAPLLDVAKQSYRRNSLLAGSALLLATVANRDASADTVRGLLSLTVFKEAQVPEIFSTHVFHATVFALDSNTMQTLGSMLTGDTTEEQKEEIISVLAMYQNTGGWDSIGTYLVGETDQENDLAIETAVAALRSTLPTERFRLLTERAALSAPWKAKIIERVGSSDASNYSVQGMAKKWSFASLTLFDDGIVIDGPNGYSVFSPYHQAH